MEPTPRYAHLDPPDELPPLPPAPPRPPLFNRMAGPTDGPYSGNARFILALVLVCAAVALIDFCAVVDYCFGVTRADAIVHDGFVAIVAAFNLITGLYFGARIAQTRR